MRNKTYLRNKVLLDLEGLLELNINTRKAIKKVKSGFFDNDITEFDEGGMSISEISDYIQMMS